MKGNIYEKTSLGIAALVVLPMVVLIVMPFIYHETTVRLWGLLFGELMFIGIGFYLVFNAIFLDQITGWSTDQEKKDTAILRWMAYAVAAVVTLIPIWSFISEQEPMYVTEFREFAASQDPDTWYTVSGTVIRTPSYSVTGRVSGGRVVIETDNGEELETSIGFFPALERGEHYEFVLSANGKYILDVVR